MGRTDKAAETLRQESVVVCRLGYLGGAGDQERGAVGLAGEKGGQAAWESIEGVGEAELAHSENTGTVEVGPSSARKTTKNFIQLLSFGNTETLIIVAISRPVRLCSRRATTATSLASWVKRYDVGKHKKQNPRMEVRGFCRRM
ncbi:hypothetical protein RSO01_77140 [Reyranella soli]|uniref:Uncharacterized protein n=1 Tax=Reyranella soli TaxID=1230389 RepID=A0A512NNN8_9HYPH|nr:hypothetical protein RSO01_77140 [Reyranella soli]